MSAIFAHIPERNPGKPPNGGPFRKTRPPTRPQGPEPDPRVFVPDPLCGAVFTGRRVLVTPGVYPAPFSTGPFGGVPGLLGLERVRSAQGPAGRALVRGEVSLRRSACGGSVGRRRGGQCGNSVRTAPQWERPSAGTVMGSVCRCGRIGSGRTRFCLAARNACQ